MATAASSDISPADSNELILQEFEILFAEVTALRDLVVKYSKTKVTLLKDKLDEAKEIRKAATPLLRKSLANNQRLEPKLRLDLSRKISAMNEIIEVISVKYHEALEASQSITSSQKNKDPVSVASNPRNGVRLPDIHVPPFSNNIKDFPVFIKLFQAVYGNNESLTNADRFYYLQTLLRAEALALVSHYPLTDDGYNRAINALKERYDCQRTLVSSHLTSLFNFSPAKRATPDSLKKYLEVHNDNVQALKTIPDIDLADALLLHISLRNLDSYTRRLFENQLAQNTIPTYKDLMTFVTKTQHSLFIMDSEKIPDVTETPRPFQKSGLSSPKALQVQATPQPAKPNKPKPLPPANSEKTFSCIFCSSSDHRITRCSTFLATSNQDRSAWVSIQKRCLACLSNLHLLPACTSKKCCIYCSSKSHHSLLCPNKLSKPASNSNIPTAPALSGQTNTCLSQSAPTSASYSTIFGTVVCSIIDKCGFVHEATILLDTGSNQNLITAATAKRLGLDIAKNKIKISGIANSNHSTLGTVSLTLQSRYNDFKLPISANVIEKIANTLQPTAINLEFAVEVKKLMLADPNPFDSKEVHILLNASSTMDILCSGSQQPNNFEFSDPFVPKPINTAFGFVIMGRVPTLNFESPASSLFAYQPENLPAKMVEIFERDAIPDPESESPVPASEHIEMENHFLATHSRDTDGKFIVRLPFTTNPVPIGNNRKRAFACFRGMENRLFKNQQYPIYQAALQDYIDKREIVPSSVSNQFLFNSHIIIKRSSGKPKLVFDPTLTAPGFTTTFNDQLLCGPPLQRHINYVILSVRWYEVCFTADIDTFYRSIKISPEDSQKMHIISRIDSNGLVSPDGSLTELEITHLCYGLKNSPFTAIRCLKQLCMENSTELPRACQALDSESYIDDIWTGSESILSCIKLRIELTELLAKGQFTLSKFASSHPEVLTDIADCNLAANISFSEPDESSIPVLGLHWNPKRDIFCFQVTEFTGPITRRTCTSYLARTYDSLGLINPVIFWIKSFIQNLWIDTKNEGWDEPVCNELANQWTTFVNDMSAISTIAIPRFIANPNGKNWLTLFSDASEKGYSCAAYLVSSQNNSSSNVSNLLIAKSKLAPRKTKRTIPQLELAAIQLAAKLINWIFSGNLPYKINGTYLFSDSTIALAYLNTPVDKLKVYAANRVSNIMSYTRNHNVKFLHCCSEDNAADPASRGLNPSQLINCRLWFHGPSFLETNFPPDQPPMISECSSLPDVKSEPLTLTVNQPSDIENSFSKASANLNKNSIFVGLISKCSTFTRLVNTTVYVLRFINHLKDKNKVRPSSILPTISEKDEASTLLYRYSQLSIPKLPLHLTPFLDSSGVLRVGGRLENADLPYSTKHPILLHPKCPLSTLLCRHYHSLCLHGGLSLSLSLTRRSYWIMSGRSLMRQVIHKCVFCAKWHPKTLSPQQGNLPIFRTQACFPFRNVVGVDAFGPYSVKLSARRNSACKKIWGLIFVCESTRAVHLEPISSMSANDFLAALDRFCSRRSLPAEIRADNGGNFRGGSKLITDLVNFLKSEKDTIVSHLSTRNIKFSFIPAYSPWFGSWEPLIKQVKYFLTPLIKYPLYFEEFVTLFTKVEALMNSRPYLPAQLTELGEMLCPGHFLVGGPLVLPPEKITDASEANLTISQRWSRLRSILQIFWKKWSYEVLHTYQQKQKWPRLSESVKIGDLVWIKDAQTNPGSWPIGKIVKTYKGQDNVTRVVDVQAADSVLRRAVRNLALVPISN